MRSADRSEVSSFCLLLLILMGISDSSPEGTCDAMTRLDFKQVCCSLMLSMYMCSCYSSIDLRL
jgi:hypothetical protein